MAILLAVHPSVPARTEHGIPVRGVASWYDLTVEIYTQLGVDTSLVSPVPTSEYPTKAVRPQYSVLGHAHTIDCGVAEMQNWKTALQESLPNIVKAISEEIPQ